MDPRGTYEENDIIDPMTVPNHIIFGPSDGMCGGNNYIKREKTITD